MNLTARRSGGTSARPPNVSNMLKVADSASPPSNRVITRAAARQGVHGWIGYLRSPYAADSWTPAELDRIITNAGLMLPVYVGPYDAKTLAGMNPERDAQQALSDLHELTEPHSGVQLVCLDIEPGAWEASPADVLHYFAAFRAATHGHNIDVAPYGSPSTLIGLGQHENIRWVWCASWRARYGVKPSPLWADVIAPPGLGTAWHGQRAWQQAGGVRVFGTRADLSLFPDDFPLIAHKTTPTRPQGSPATPRPSTPAPVPAPAPDARASIAVTVDGHTYRGSIPRTG